MRYGSLVLITLLMGCMPIQQTSQLSQPTGQRLEAAVGDTVLSIVKEKSLPSELVEGADLLGRKTMTGLTTLQYRGVENGKAVFKRRTVDMVSKATDLNPAEKSTVHNQDDMNIFVNLAQANKVVVVEQRSVVIESANNHRIIYSIRETPKPKQPSGS